ncbi:MAG: GNAT family N-acetyltransferase [Eubacteriales bacterium]
MWSPLHQVQVSELIEYLEKNSPNTSSIIANIQYASTIYNPYIMRSGRYFVYNDENRKIDGVIAIYSDGNAFIHTYNPTAQESCIKTLTKSKYHSIWGLSNWLPHLGMLSSNIGMHMDARQLITMVRDKSIPLPKSDCDLVRIDNKFYLNKYIPFIKVCLYEGFGFKPSARDIKLRMHERTENEPYFLLYDDKVPVAQAHIQAITSTHGYIAGICTPRAYRRRGYARQITARACRFVEGRGKLSALTVNKTNINAIKLYESLGFKPVDHMLVYMKARKFTGDENQ